MNRVACLCSIILVLPGTSVLAQEALSFSKQVMPFLTKYCTECHKTGKIKGGANLENFQAIMKGGKNGRALLVPGKPDQSRLVTTTEHTAKPVMPPKKSKQPTAKEKEVLRTWVAAGAKDDTVIQGAIPTSGFAIEWAWEPRYLELTRSTIHGQFQSVAGALGR